ncbi:MAG: carboxypeptidase regulatory-like domain-containing protein, partial [Pyrinomonadaceae bacterium]
SDFVFRVVSILLVTIVSFCAVLPQQKPIGNLRGKVVDEQSAVIQGAAVTLTLADGNQRTGISDRSGEFSFNGITAGHYSLSVSAVGFAPNQLSEGDVVAGKTAIITLMLAITVNEKVEVGSSEPPINTDPAANASAVVLNEDDLKALPSDPTELEAALQALAGPSAGPSGGQIFVDGFSGGKLPPRNSIREIRINQNPFSSEYDRVGFGRIEILTKPGADKWRGEIGSEFEDESVNSRNPFAANRPPFQLRNINGNFGGPIIKGRTSFFVDMEKENIDNNSLINARVLAPDLSVRTLQQGVVSPLKTYEFNVRVDHQINPQNTLVMRDFGSGARTENAGLNGFDLLSRAYSARDSDNTLRLTETAIFSPMVFNEISFQYIRRRAAQNSTDNTPTIRIPDAFTGGGANTGQAFSDEDRFELQNFTTWARGDHTVKFGGRVRRVHILDSSPGNFSGTFTFTDLDQYRNTILHVPGARPTQFSIAGGDPLAEAQRTDVGVFGQDDWRVRPNLTLSFGLRYETQTNISDYGDLAPRISFAYSPAVAANQKQNTVFRGGFGIFYERFSEGFTLQTNRFNGIDQQQYIVTDPGILSQPVFTAGGGITNAPTVQTLAAFAQPQTRRTVADDLAAPRTTQLALSVERQLPMKTTVSVTYVFSHTDRLLRSRNINAPINGVRPTPGAGNIFQYESTGKFTQNQLLLNFKSSISDRISLFGNYALGRARSDSEGASTFPANQYDLSNEYGNSAVDIRHRFVLGGNIKAPLGIALSPFITYRSGVPFNITTGTDLNGDTLFTDRPSLATGPLEPGVIITRFGAFDPTPEPGELIIPRNYGRGSSFFVINLRLAKEIGFGGGDRSDQGKITAPGGDDRNRTGTNSPFGGGVGGGRPASTDDDETPYKLEFSVQIRNLLNHNNGGTPVGNLSSTFFGQPVSLASGFGFGGGRQSGGNRRLRFEVVFSF